MTQSKQETDRLQKLAVDLCKTYAKRYNLDAGKLAQIFQKHPMTKDGVQKALKEVELLVHNDMVSIIKKTGLPF